MQQEVQRNLEGRGGEGRGEGGGITNLAQHTHTHTHHTPLPTFPRILSPASGLSAKRNVHEAPSCEKFSTDAVTPRNILNAALATVSIDSRKLRHLTPPRDFAQNSSTKRTPMLYPIASSWTLTSAGSS